MASQISLFENPSFGSVRVIMRGEDPWFVAVDVAKCLGYSDYRSAVTDFCKKAEVVRVGDLPTPDFSGFPDLANNPAGFRIIPESDLYRLIMRSRLPNAEAFQDWVVEDVLPQIRKTGMYVPDFSDPAAAARAWADAYEQQQREKQARLAAERQAKEKQLALEQEQAAHLQTADKLTKVTTVATKLAVNQGLADNYRKVKAIPWLKDYFDITGAKSPFYGNCGKFMTMISNQRNFPITMVADEDWGQVKAYTLEAWEYFKQLIDAGMINGATKYIGKYYKF